MTMKPSAADVKTLEQLLAEQAPELEKTAPQQLQEMEALLSEIKASPTGEISAASQETLKNLFVWQVELKRAQYQKRIEALSKDAKKDPAAAKAMRALKDVVQTLDDAKRAVKAPAATSAQALRTMETSAERAQASLVKASQGSEAGPAVQTASAKAKLNGKAGNPDFAPPSWVTKIEQKKK